MKWLRLSRNWTAHSLLNWIRIYSCSNWIRILSHLHSSLNWIRMHSHLNLNPVSYWNFVLPYNIAIELLYVELLCLVYVSTFISIMKTLVLVLVLWKIKIRFQANVIFVCVPVILKQNPTSEIVK